MKNIQLLIVFLLVYAIGFAQNENKFTDGLLREITYSEPFISEIHSTINKIEITSQKDHSNYNLSENMDYYKRPLTEIHLGFDADLFSIDFGKLNNGSAKWGLGLSLPASIHVLEDMWEPVTAAVIDVDYRFGSPRIRGIRRFEPNSKVRNISFSWLPIFHECTHLGDELVLYLNSKDYPISRVNVSYEYTELQLTINDPDGSMDNNHAFRFGARYRISNRGYGWFSTESFAVDTNTVNFDQSTHRLEYNFEYEMQRSKGFLASKRAMNFFSIDLGSRVKLGIPVYHKVDGVWQAKDKKERNGFTVNAYFGWKFFAKNKTTRPLGVYFHYYRGVNIWGQLRNQGKYGFMGIAITYQP